MKKTLLAVPFAFAACFAAAAQAEPTDLGGGFSLSGNAAIVSDYRLGDAENGLMAIARLRILAGGDVTACLMSGDTDGGLMQAAREAGLILVFSNSGMSLTELSAE